MIGDEVGDHIMEGFIDHVVDLNFVSVDLGEPLRVFYAWKLHGQICEIERLLNIFKCTHK